LFPDDAIDWDILSQIQHIPCIFGTLDSVDQQKK
jgi:hypothetical protein